MIGQLSTASEEFRVLWSRGDVDQRSSGAKTFHHPGLGVLSLHYENFALLSEPRHRLVTFTPAPGSASEAALQLLAGWAAPGKDRSEASRART